jgi:hypothetical protein
MNAAVGITKTYSCSYSTTTGKFTISATGGFVLLWNTGAHKTTSIASLVGFPDTADTVGLLIHTGERVSVAARLRGDETSSLLLPNWPIVAVMSVVDEDGTAYVEGYDQDYIIENLYLKKVDGTWPEKNFFVFYQAGYLVIPADIVLVAYEAIARKWKTMKEQGWGESGRTMPDGSTSTVNADGALTKSQREILARYKRPIL